MSSKDIKKSAASQGPNVYAFCANDRHIRDADRLRSIGSWHPIEYMGLSKGKILVVSRDPRLADTRKTILEAAGFSVVAAMDDSSVEEACSKDGIKLIMLGYSLSPADKRRVWAKSRLYCDVPVLELHQRGKPELIERNVFAHEALKADDFLDTVHKLLHELNSR